jgi:hypothetical protein
MISGWKGLSKMTKIRYIGGRIGFIGLAIIVLLGVTGISAILTWKFKLCPLYQTTCSDTKWPGDPAQYAPRQLPRLTDTFFHFKFNSLKIMKNYHI